MQLKFFQMPLGGEGGLNEELNGFLRSHRVLKVQRELVQRESTPCWAVCVEYLDGTAPQNSGSRSGMRGEEKKDYKQMLSETDFAVFTRLRDLRRSLAESEGVPVYAVFSNEQLAKFAQNRPQTKAELEKVDGVGGARSEKYGAKVLEVTVSKKEGA